MHLINVIHPKSIIFYKIESMMRQGFVIQSYSQEIEKKLSDNVELMRRNNKIIEEFTATPFRIAQILKHNHVCLDQMEKIIKIEDNQQITHYDKDRMMVQFLSSTKVMQQTMKSLALWLEIFPTLGNKIKSKDLQEFRNPYANLCYLCEQSVEEQKIRRIKEELKLKVDLSSFKKSWQTQSTVQEKKDEIYDNTNVYEEHTQQNSKASQYLSHLIDLTQKYEYDFELEEDFKKPSVLMQQDVIPRLLDDFWNKLKTELPATCKAKAKKIFEEYSNKTRDVFTKDPTSNHSISLSANPHPLPQPEKTELRPSHGHIQKKESKPKSKEDYIKKYQLLLGEMQNLKLDLFNAKAQIKQMEEQKKFLKNQLQKHASSRKYESIATQTDDDLRKGKGKKANPHQYHIIEKKKKPKMRDSKQSFQSYNKDLEHNQDLQMEQKSDTSEQYVGSSNQNLQSQTDEVLEDEPLSSYQNMEVSRSNKKYKNSKRMASNRRQTIDINIKHASMRKQEKNKSNALLVILNEKEPIQNQRSQKQNELHRKSQFNHKESKSQLNRNSISVIPKQKSSKNAGPSLHKLSHFNKTQSGSNDKVSMHDAASKKNFRITTEPDQYKKTHLNKKSILLKPSQSKLADFSESDTRKSVFKQMLRQSIDGASQKECSQHKSKQKIKALKALPNKIFHPQDLQIFGGIQKSYNFQKVCQSQGQTTFSQSQSTFLNCLMHFIINLKNFKTPLYLNLISFLLHPYQTIQKMQIIQTIEKQKREEAVRIRCEKLLKWHKTKCKSIYCTHLSSLYDRIGLDIKVMEQK